MTIYTVDPTGADIIGFNPAVDRLNFGGNSVHNLIVTKTSAGFVAITDPWSTQVQVLDGIRFTDLTAANMGIVGNEHLRQDMGGVMSWERGLGPREAGTVYIRSHEAGLHTVIDDFDPATGTISFLYFGTRERLTVTDTPDGLLIAVQPTGQSFLFRGVLKAELDPARIEFHHDQIVEDRLDDAFGLPQQAFTLVAREGMITPEAPAGELTDGWQMRDPYGAITGEGPPPPTGPAIDPPGGVLKIAWAWGTNTLVDFDPKTDVIDLGWFHPGEFKIAQVNNQVTLYVVGNRQAYTLEGVSLGDLDMPNFKANDPAALEAVHSFLDHDGDHHEPVDLPNGVLRIRIDPGEHMLVAFDPATDVVRFGKLDADLFEITEVDGSVVISLPDSDQSYTLYGVGLDELARRNLRARDPEARAEIRAALEDATPVVSAMPATDDPLI